MSGVTPQARRIASSRAAETAAGSKRSASMLAGTTAMRSGATRWRSTISSAIWSETAITRSPRTITLL